METNHARAFSRRPTCCCNPLLQTRSKGPDLGWARGRRLKPAVSAAVRLPVSDAGEPSGIRIIAPLDVFLPPKGKDSPTGSQRPRT